MLCRLALLPNSGRRAIVSASRNAVLRQAIAAGLLFQFAVFFRLAGVRPVPHRFLGAAAADANDPLVIMRNRGNPDVRGYVLCLAQLSSELFDARALARRPIGLGAAMYRTVATIASVALDRQITKREVQRWYDQQPIRRKKRAKGRKFKAKPG